MTYQCDITGWASWRVNVLHITAGAAGMSRDMKHVDAAIPVRPAVLLNGLERLTRGAEVSPPSSFFLVDVDCGGLVLVVNVLL